MQLPVHTHTRARARTHAHTLTHACTRAYAHKDILSVNVASIKKKLCNLSSSIVDGQALVVYPHDQKPIDYTTFGWKYLLCSYVHSLDDI